MKHIRNIIVSILVIFLLVGCGNSSDEKSKDDVADKGLDVIGDHLKWDPNKLVNDGEPIELEYWTWGDNDPVFKMIEQYEEIYPNVTIKGVVHPWDDFWTKLPLSLKGEDGPAFFNIHNSQHELIAPYLEAYDLDIDELKEDFIGVEPHIIDGQVHYIDYIINTGNIYYNLDHWEEAGLTEKDIPETWDELIEVAKKLTIYEGDDLVQAGFNFNDEGFQAMYMGLNYQQGELLFQDDGKTVNFDNPSTKKTMEFLISLYDEHGVGSKDFGTNSTESFGNGQSSMVYKWGWFKGELDNKYPDINYAVFATPTLNENPPAFDRYNGESTPGINKNQSEEQREVAQDFIRFILASEDYSIDGALNLASFPTKKSLGENEKILSNEVLSAIQPRVDRLIWPGPFPATLESTAKEQFEEALYNGKDINKALEDAQKQMEEDMKTSDFASLEEFYEHYNEFD